MTVKQRVVCGVKTERDLRGSQREGDVCIRGQAKPKSSAVVLHTTSGLKMPALSQHTVNADACTEQALLYTVFLFSYQFIQGEAKAAIFIQDEKATLPFLTLKHNKQNHYFS